MFWYRCEDLIPPLFSQYQHSKMINSVSYRKQPGPEPRLALVGQDPPCASWPLAFGRQDRPAASPRQP